MELKLQKLEQHLVKYHFIAQDNVSIIIDEEFDFIEECLSTTQMSIEEIAKALINIYMVA